MTREHSPDSAFPLNLASEGQEVILVGFAGNDPVIRRLAELGLTPNTRISVDRCIRGQPIVISVRGSKLAIGRDTADRIRVCLSDETGSFRCDRARAKRGWRKRFRRRHRPRHFPRGRSDAER